MTTPAPQRPPYATQNGKVVPFEEAKVSIMAPGLTFAAAVFEGLRAYWNEETEQLSVFRAPEHLERLNFSMSMIELDNPPSAEEFTAQMVELLRACAYREDTYIRIQAYIDDWGDMLATGPVGSSIICRQRARVPAFEEGRHFGVSSWRRNADDASPPRIKATANYLNSRLAGLEAKRSGYGGAIILNRDGTLSEGPGGCIFIRRGDSLVTPPVSAGILESVTRYTMIDLAREAGIEVTERDIGRTELHLAAEAFYCGTGQEMVPILSVDGKSMGDGAPGKVTRQLQKRYDDVIRGRDERYAHWLTPVYG